MNYCNYIDHTLLKANAIEKDIKKLCKEAKEYKFFSVCINPCFVKYAKKCLTGSEVKVCTVIGFPLGANNSKVKILEAKKAISDGADEIDVVFNISKFKDKKYSYVSKELSKLVALCNKKVVVKVIIETCYLDKNEIIKLSKICVQTKMDFIKTSTGFGTAGARLDDVKLIYETVKGCCKIKVSGGIKNREMAIGFLNAGASRIGTSHII